MTTTAAERCAKHVLEHSSIQGLVPTTSQGDTPPCTPTALTTSAYKLFAEIRDIHDTLSTLTSLAPGPQVDTLLTKLVNLCVESYSAEYTKVFFSINGVEHLCEKLRPICAVAEGELEKFWAGQIVRETQLGMAVTDMLYLRSLQTQ
jgi:nicotianamine synthase